MQSRSNNQFRTLRVNRSWYENNYWLVGTTSESFSLNTSLLAIIRYKCPPPCCFKLTERTVHCCNAFSLRKQTPLITRLEASVFSGYKNALCLKTSKGFYKRDFTVLYACFTFSVYKSKIIWGVNLLNFQELQELMDPQQSWPEAGERIVKVKQERYEAKSKVRGRAKENIYKPGNSEKIHHHMKIKKLVSQHQLMKTPWKGLYSQFVL